MTCIVVPFNLKPPVKFDNFAKALTYADSHFRNCGYRIDTTETMEEIQNEVKKRGIKMKLADYDYRLGLYSQKDIFGNDAAGIAIQMFENGEPYAIVTVNVPNGFGICEKIGIKNAAYLDTNNCPWAVGLFEESGVARNTGLKKESGFCEYPLFIFDEKWLRSIDEKIYEMYAKQYDE